MESSYEDVAHNPESELATQLRPGANEPLLEAFGVKDPSAAIGAGGEVVQVVQAVEMPLLGHALVTVYGVAG